jgi:hypothetical protein
MGIKLRRSASVKSGKAKLKRNIKMERNEKVKRSSEKANKEYRHGVL